MMSKVVIEQVDDVKVAPATLMWADCADDNADAAFIGGNDMVVQGRRIRVVIDDLMDKHLGKKEFGHEVKRRLQSATSQITQPGEEPKVVYHKRSDEGTTEVVPDGCAFEEMPLSPYGWPINPFNGRKYKWATGDTIAVLAKLFVDAIAHKCLRYDEELQMPMYFDGTKWMIDRGCRNWYRIASNFYEMCLNAALCIDRPHHKEAWEAKVVKALKNPSGRKNLFESWKTIESEKVTGADFDADIYKFNMINGVFDFCKMSFQPGHRPEDMMTQIAGVAYDPEASSQPWDNFLASVFANQEYKIGLMNRWFAYCMTGDISLNKFFICFGDGRNGKSLTSRVFEKLMGSYGGSASEATLCTGNWGGNNEDLAATDKKRYITVSELNGEKQFNSQMLKRLTGEDPVTVARKYEHAFTLRTYGHITMWTNAIPRFRDPTIRSSNRMVAVGYDRTFTQKEQDPHLYDKLTTPAALSGVFNRLIEAMSAFDFSGALAKDCLHIPAPVAKETSQILHDDDEIFGWIEEYLTYTGNPADYVGGQDLYTSYVEYASKSGIHALGKKTFYICLDTRYLTRRQHTGGVHSMVGWIIRKHGNPAMTEDQIDAAINATRAAVKEAKFNKVKASESENATA